MVPGLRALKLPNCCAGAETTAEKSGFEAQCEEGLGPNQRGRDFLLLKLESILFAHSMFHYLLMFDISR